jgi:glycosyltransferase involved in cell wall biosynthesis
VVATDVGGTPEVVAVPGAGEIVADRDPATVAAAIGRVVARRLDRQAVRTHAEQFSWDATANGLRELLAAIVKAHRTQMQTNELRRDIRWQRLTH